MICWRKVLNAVSGGLIIRCDAATRLFSDSRDRKLTRRERLGLFLHPYVCPPCATHVARSRRMYTVLKTEAETEATPAVPEEVRLRLEARVLRELESKR